MAVNDETLMGIYDELQTLRYLKQIELGLMIGKSNIGSLSELETITDMIANPKKYFAKDEKENKDDKD